MKNKNGFIATGLIYSFFVIFLTLFLTTITRHIDNKIYLSHVEVAIKEKLNSYKTVRDFKPGDLINFVDNCGSVDENTFANNLSKAHVVAGVITNEDKNIEGICGKYNSECLILYSYTLVNYSTDAVTYEDIKKDISTGYLNGTFINKILYTFHSSSGTNKSYNLGSGKFAKVDTTDECNADTGDEIFCNDYGKIVDNGDNTKYRKRTVKTFNDNKIERCSVEDAMGVIYVKE